MKLINYKKKELICKEDWAIAIKQRFGDAQSFVMKMNPDVQEYCSDRLPLLCADDTIPTLVRVCIIYGNKVAETLLNLHLTEAIITMGEKSIDTDEVKQIARTIRADENLKTLKIPMILHFFKRLKSGQFKIYGTITPRKILECMQEFYDKAIEQQRQFNSQKEQQQRNQERNQHLQNAITWEEYARRNNITTSNPINKLTK